MLKKTAVCFMALTCAAAFTLVSAQLPWEAGYTSSESAPSDESSSGGESSGDGASSYESGSPSYESSSSSPSSESPYSSEASYSTESSEVSSSASDDAKPEKPEKPKKEKKERVAKERTAPAGFSAQKSCPVCNSAKIKKNLYAESGNGRIHVCSIACIGRVKRNPDKFIQILEKRGEGPER